LFIGSEMHVAVHPNNTEEYGRIDKVKPRLKLPAEVAFSCIQFPLLLNTTPNTIPIDDLIGDRGGKFRKPNY
jgi:hypothetical protein